MFHQFHKLSDQYRDALPRIIAMLLALITLLAYLPALNNGFLIFDDQTYLTNNSMIQAGPTWAGLKWAFTTFYFSNWHPLTWIAYFVDFQLFRLNPTGHHFVNILFHSANTLLLFVLLRRLTGGLWSSAFVAALFAWHPLHVESVAWIAELKDVMSTFFGLLAMLAYERFARRPSADDCPQTERVRWWRWLFPSSRFYWSAVVCFALSLMSKSMLVTLPCVLLLLDYWPLQRLRNVGGCVIEKWPLFLLAAGASVLTCLAQRDTAIAGLQDLAVSARLQNAVTAYVGYLWKTVWPAHLAVLYPLPHHFPWSEIVVAGLVLVVISAVVWAGARQQPWLLVGWLWFLGTLVPVIGLVQVGGQAMADRYTYFPLIGIFLALALSVRELARRFQLSGVLVAGPAMLVLTVCLMRTDKQLGYWRNTETLFTHTLEITTDNPLAHTVLGEALLDDQDLPRALKEFQEVVRIRPGNAKAYTGIGRCLSAQGKPAEALEYFQTAVQLQPQSVLFRDRLGLILMELGRFDEASQQFSEAMRLDASYAPAHFQMGRTLLKQGHGVEAVKYFRQALRLEPNNVQMLIYTAHVLAADEDPQVRNGAEACVLAQHAAHLAAGTSPTVLDILAVAYAEAGRFDAAVAAEQQAMELARANGSNEDEPAMRQRLELFQKHQPWRESFRRH